MSENKIDREIKLMTETYRRAVIDTYEIISDIFKNTISFYDKKLKELEKNEVTK